MAKDVRLGDDDLPIGPAPAGAKEMERFAPQLGTSPPYPIPHPESDFDSLSAQIDNCSRMVAELPSVAEHRRVCQEREWALDERDRYRKNSILNWQSFKKERERAEATEVDHKRCLETVAALREALEGIAFLGGRCLLGPEYDTERMHELGSAKAFDQAAELARAALARGEPA